MAFYRGYIPNLLGIIPYAGIDLAIYEVRRLSTRTLMKRAGAVVVLVSLSSAPSLSHLRLTISALCFCAPGQSDRGRTFCRCLLRLCPSLHLHPQSSSVHSFECAILGNKLIIITE